MSRSVDAPRGGIADAAPCDMAAQRTLPRCSLSSSPKCQSASVSSATPGAAGGPQGSSAPLQMRRDRLAVALHYPSCDGVVSSTLVLRNGLMSTQGSNRYTQASRGRLRGGGYLYPFRSVCDSGIDGIRPLTLPPARCRRQSLLSVQSKLVSSASGAPCSLEVANGGACFSRRRRQRPTLSGLFFSLVLLCAFCLPATLRTLFGFQHAAAMTLAKSSLHTPAETSLQVLQPLRELGPSLGSHAAPSALRHLRLFRVSAPGDEAERPPVTPEAAAKGMETDAAAAETCDRAKQGTAAKRESIVLALLPSRDDAGLPSLPPVITSAREPSAASVISTLLQSSSSIPSTRATFVLSVSPEEASVSPVPSEAPTGSASAPTSSSTSSLFAPPSRVSSTPLLAAAASAACCADALLLPFSYAQLNTPLALLGQAEPQMLLLSAVLEQQRNLCRSVAAFSRECSAAADTADALHAGPLEASPCPRRAALLPEGVPTRVDAPAKRAAVDADARRAAAGGSPCLPGRAMELEKSDIEGVVARKKPLIVLLTDFADPEGDHLMDGDSLPVVSIRAEGDSLDDLSLQESPFKAATESTPPSSSWRWHHQVSKALSEERQRDRAREKRREAGLAVARLLAGVWANIQALDMTQPDSREEEDGDGKKATSADSAGDDAAVGQSHGDAGQAEPPLEEGRASEAVRQPTTQRSRGKSDAAATRRDGVSLGSLYSVYVVFVPPLPPRSPDEGSCAEDGAGTREEALGVARRVRHTVEQIVLSFENAKQDMHSRSSSVEGRSSAAPREPLLQSLTRVAQVCERTFGDGQQRGPGSASQVKAADPWTAAASAQQSVWATFRNIREAVNGGDAERFSRVTWEYDVRKIKEETRERFDTLVNLQPPSFHLGYSRSFPVVASELRRASLSLFVSSVEGAKRETLQSDPVATSVGEDFARVSDTFRDELDSEIARSLSPRYFLQLSALRTEITRQFRKQLEHIQREQLVALEAYLVRRQQQKDDGVDENMPELLSYRRFSRLIQALLTAAGTTFLAEIRRFHRSFSQALLAQLTTSMERPSLPASLSSRRTLDSVEQRQHQRLLQTLREMASSVLQQQQILLSEYAGGLKGGVWTTNSVASWVLDGVADASEKVRERLGLKAAREVIERAEQRSVAVRTVLGWWRRRKPIEVSLQYVSPTAFGLSNFRRQVGLSPDEVTIAGRGETLKGRIQKLWSGAWASAGTAASPEQAPVLDEALAGTSLLPDLSRLSSLMVYGQQEKRGT